MRIAYVVPPSRQFAGIERVVHEIASGLMRAHGDELDVHVVYSSRYDEAELVDPPYTPHVLEIDRLIRLPGPLRRLARAERFDVLVAPQVEASVLSWVATRGLGLPIFLSHLHGNPRLEEDEGTLRTRAAFRVYRAAVTRSIDAVLAVSPSLARFAEAELSARAPVFFAKNPVRDLGAPPRAATRPDGPFTFACVARLSRQKGQDLLLRALALARHDLGDVRLVLVGNGPAEDELRALATSLGLDDIVEFAGHVSDPRPVLSSADCFVLASRWEGFGVALAEALQFGLPILTTDCDFGPSDLVTDPRIGDIVASEDPDELAAGLRRAVARIDAPGDAGLRREVAAGYLPAPAVESHVGILRGIIDARLPGRVAPV